MASSDGRNTSGSNAKAAASPDISPDDAERFASVLRPMWELEPSPHPAPVAPVASAASGAHPASPPPSAPQAPPQPSGMRRHAPTQNMFGAPPIEHLADSLDSSDALDDAEIESFNLNDLPAPPAAQPGANAAVPGGALRTEPFAAQPAFSFPEPSAAPEPEPAPEVDNPNAYAVRAHRPPQRQSVEQAASSIEVAPGLAPPVRPDFGPPAPEVYGPSQADVVARARRHQPTLVIRPGAAQMSALGMAGAKKSKTPLVLGIVAVVVVVLLLAAGGLYKYTESVKADRDATPAGTSGASGTSGTSGPIATATAVPSAVQTAAAPIVAPVAAPAPTTAPTDTPPAVDPASAAASAATTATAPAGKPGAKPGGHPVSGKPVKPPHSNGGIVRSSPF